MHIVFSRLFLKCSSKESMNQFLRPAIPRQTIAVQVFNQEFVRAGRVFLELGHLDKHSSTTQEGRVL